MTVHFSGDVHAGHRAILKYCNRPFSTIEEHDDALIGERNKVVGPDDTVYDLGDFTLGDEKMAWSYFPRLNGKLYVLGNNFHHDKRWLKAKNPYWTKHHEVTILPPIHTMKIDDLFIVLCHFPFAHWPREHYGSISLFAHCHGRYVPEGRALDVGVDNAMKVLGSYRPFSLTEIVEYMEGR